MTVVPLATPLALSHASIAAASIAPPATAPSPSPMATVAPSAKEGLKVGQKLPAFTVAGVDGKPISGAELTAQRMPYILFFFATW